MRHSLSRPTVTCICMGELPQFHHGPTTSFLHSQPIQTSPSGPGLICAAGLVFIWDDPSVTPLSWSFTKGVPLLYPQCGTSILFWGGKCFCWIKKAVSGWKPVLGRAVAMEWVSRVIFLEAAICVAGNLSANVGRGYPASAYKQGIGVAFKQPVIILHVSFCDCHINWIWVNFGSCNDGKDKRNVFSINMVGLQAVVHLMRQQITVVMTKLKCFTKIWNRHQSHEIVMYREDLTVRTKEGSKYVCSFVKLGISV